MPGREIIEVLRRAEQAIALLDRVQPLNAKAERQRLVLAWQGGRHVGPEFEYAPAPDLSATRRALRAIGSARTTSLEEQLFAERARELDLEAELVLALGSVEFAGIARRRFDPSSAEAEAARLLAESWSLLALPEQLQARHISDDASDPKSLLSVIERGIGREKLPLRIEVREDMSAVAATAEGVVRIRRGVELGAEEAERIALHEIWGHAVPRLRGRTRGGIHAVGSAGASDDEEGRALWLEEQSGFLGDARRSELGRRHLAALAARMGKSFVETTAMLLDRGAPLERAIELGCRVFRGGPLAREVVYLSAFAKVRSAFERKPALRSILAEGRLGVEAAERLLAAG